jgi:hypothetical protein
VEESMKKIKSWLKPKNLIINTSPKIKMSELISEYASDYINMGENTEERQNYLNGACTAWNIAILDEKHREEALRRAIEGYKRMNPGTDDAENFEQDLRTLIKKKLEMFPEKKKVIIDAMIEPISETKYRINIASTDDKELLKEIFKKDPTF